ncbi:MAG TPA: hypothetical protein VGG25_10245 [Streptosporangiaceae bacterium]|jgi:hypothetical protein
MATCDLGFDHGEHEETEPVVVETDSGPNENDVKIAEIQAAQGVKTAQIYAAENDADLVAENARLRGELDGMRTVLDRVAPEPADDPPPDPIVVPVPDPEPGPEPGPAAPPDTGSTPAPKKSGSGGFWSGYR